jgi:hypothetical protein
MTDEQIALGRRAVACKGWRWMAGMRYCSVAVAAETASPLSFNGYQRVGEDVDMVAYTDWVPCLPDVEDPATLGCLLALVREAYRDASKLWDGHVEVRRDHRILFFVVSFRHDESGALVEDTLATGGTEAEALVASLEEAP